MRCCSVPGCPNNSSKCQKGFKFYSFPSGSRDQNNRKELWIRAVNKAYSNGKPWIPSQYACICEVHFVNNKVSNDPNSPSYLPTLLLKKELSYCRNPRRSAAQLMKDSEGLSFCNLYFQPDLDVSSSDFPSPEKKTKENSSEVVKDRLTGINTNSPNSCKVVAVQSLSNIDKIKPTSRWGHTMTMISEEAMLLIGGQGERDSLNKDAIWKLDLTQAKWSSPDSLNCNQRPETRMGHTAVFDPTLRYLYLFGGSKKKKWFGDVYVLDVDDCKWRLVEAKGVTPPSRSYHSCVLYEYKLWVFGGTKPSPTMDRDECSNDVYIFDCLEEAWQQPSIEGTVPKPRSGHSGSLVQNRMVVFGGWDAPVCFNDVHILDMAQKKWFKPHVRGAPPSYRSWHSSCVLSGSRILIHGGFNGEQPLDDLFIFDVDLLTWTNLQLHPRLSRRTGHAAICLPYRHENGRRDQVLMFGGGDNEDSFYQDLINIMIPF